MPLDIIEVTLLQNKALFSSFCMVGRNSFDSSVSFETFFRYCRCIQFFNLLRFQSKSLICSGKKVTENKLKSFDYGFKIFIPLNVKANFSFAIHQSKTVVMILVNTFDLSSLILAAKQCWAVPKPDVFWYRLNGTKMNIIYEYSKTKNLSRDTNIISQMHWTSNNFWYSATTIGGF